MLVKKHMKLTGLKKLLYIASFLFPFLMLSQTSADTQNKQPSDFWRNVRFGGGIGLSFANGAFSGTLAPNAIYEFNDSFGLGVGLNGTYSKTDSFKATILGGSILGFTILFTVFSCLQNSKNFM